MNKPKIRIVIAMMLIAIVLSACQAVSENGDALPEVAETALTPPPADQETIENTEDLAPKINEPPQFTITADKDLQASVSALFKAYFGGESPTFVDSDGDLIVKSIAKEAQDHPEIQAMFLPNAVMIPQTDDAQIFDFIDFSTSIAGEKVLIESGELPSSLDLVDQAGNIVEVSMPLEKVISTYGPATSFIYGVNAEDRLIFASYLGARDPLGSSVMGKIDGRFPEIMGDEFFSQENFNIEQAAALDPDLIIASVRTAWLDTAKEMDFSLFMFDAETPDRLKEAMILTGQLFGPSASAYARAWIAYYEGVVESIQTQLSAKTGDEHLRVLFTGTEPLRVASGEMYQTDIIESAGGISVSSELSGYWNDVNLEQIALWDPDVIIVPRYGGAAIEAITESEEWQILEAVQNGCVYQMPKLVVPWDTPTPDSVLAIVWMAQLLYPDEVSLSCAEEAEYFYNTFYNYAITAEEIDTICKID